MLKTTVMGRKKASNKKRCINYRYQRVYLGFVKSVLNVEWTVNTNKKENDRQIAPARSNIRLCRSTKKLLWYDYVKRMMKERSFQRILSRKPKEKKTGKH